jgi:hypothetical protein
VPISAVVVRCPASIRFCRLEMARGSAAPAPAGGRRRRR